MRSSIFFLLFLFCNVQAVLAAEKQQFALSEGMVNPGYHEKPAWFKESFLDLGEDIEEASSLDKRILLYFYQDGCPYCGKLLKDNFADAEIAAYSKQHFEVIAINMWGDREVTSADGQATTEKNFAKSLKVQFTPTLVFLNEQGKVLLRINGYFAPHKFMTALQYVAQRKENEIKPGEFFRQQNPAKATGKLHVKTTNLAKTGDLFDLSNRAGNKPLLVIFGQKTCKACDELHLDILQREKVKQSLQPFDVVVLDTWSEDPVITPSGNKQPGRQWANTLGIQYNPSLVFFDAKGNEVFRTGGYLKSFHIKGAMDYVSSGAYLEQPEFQRYLRGVTDELHRQGIEYNLMD